jgi:hypothetical protein
MLTETMRPFVVALALFGVVTPARGDSSIASSPLRSRGTFRIEQVQDPPDEAPYRYTVWLVSTVDPARRARLPDIPLFDLGPDVTSGNVGYPSTLSVSPDERFLLREHKLYHGASALYLYTRVGALRYRAAAPAIRVDDAVRRTFARLVGGSDDGEPMGIVEFVSWSGDGKSAVVSLRGRDLAGRYDVVGWQCTVELATGRVRVTKAQRKANASALSQAER